MKSDFASLRMDGSSNDLNKELRDYLSKSNGSDSSAQNSLLSTFNKFNKLGGWMKTGNDGYVSVPTNEPLDNNRQWWFNDDSSNNDNSCFPTLTKKQRIIGCVLFASMGMFCMGMASLLIPFLILKARKFATLYTMGSLFLICSFSVLWGPMNHIKHLCTVARLPFTLAYFGSMAATIYSSVAMQSTLATVACAIAQVLALVWYVSSYIPGGNSGFKFFTKIFSSGVSSAAKKALPV